MLTLHSGEGEPMNQSDGSAQILGVSSLRSDGHDHHFPEVPDKTGRILRLRFLALTPGHGILRAESFEGARRSIFLPCDGYAQHRHIDNIPYAKTLRLRVPTLSHNCSNQWACDAVCLTGPFHALCMKDRALECGVESVSEYRASKRSRFTDPSLFQTPCRRFFPLLGFISAVWHLIDCPLNGQKTERGWLMMPPKEV
ncbi:hypothetical protein BDV18DRAFT_139521 [Aspergillus unguis]